MLFKLSGATARRDRRNIFEVFREYVYEHGYYAFKPQNVHRLIGAQTPTEEELFGDSDDESEGEVARP